MPNATIVTVVVDENYGDRVAQVALLGPVWIVDTAINRLAAEKQWKENPTQTHLLGVTTFDKCGVTDPAQVFMNVLDMVDLHHGEYSSDSPYDELQAIGTEATTEIKQQLSEFGFSVLESTAESFRAKRNPGSPDTIQ